MVASWVPWSAASLVSGAVLLVLGILTVPYTADHLDMVASLSADRGRWLLGASALVLSSLGLTLGMPAIVWLMGARTTRTGLVGLWIWSLGAIGLCAMGTMIIVLQTVVEVVSLEAAQAQTLLSEPSLVNFAYTVLVAFLVGELVVALALARARVVASWVPLVLVAHVVTAPLVLTWPGALAGVHAVVLGAALMGIASRATDVWGSQSA